MSTIGGLLKQRVAEAGILGQRVWRGRAPDGATLPYSTFLDPVSLVPGMVGDGEVLTRDRQVQFDLWQKAREESDALLVAFCALLDGADLVDPDTPRKVWRTRMTSLQRLDDPDALLVHHAVTLTVRHEGL